jgi:hypothetical protein
MPYPDSSISIGIFLCHVIKKSGKEGSFAMCVAFGIALLPGKRVEFRQQDTPNCHHYREDRKAAKDDLFYVP